MNRDLDLLDELKSKYRILRGTEISKPEFVSSGSLVLDLALGKGYPRGSLIDIFGPESSGKSLLSLLAIKEVQKIGGVAVLVDAERNYSKSLEWLKVHGIDVDRLVFMMPSCGEEVFDFIVDASQKNAVDLIVVDSVTALRPKVTIGRSLEEGQKIGSLALLMSMGLNQITPEIDNSKIICIFINQLRQVISSPFVKVSDADKATGGSALRFYSSVRIGVKKIQGSEIEQDERVLGHKIKFKIYKNKVFPPYRSGEITLYFDKGIDRVLDLFQAGLEVGIISLEGHTYRFLDYKAVGQKKCLEMLSDEKIFQEVYSAVSKKIHD